MILPIHLLKTSPHYIYFYNSKIDLKKDKDTFWIMISPFNRNKDHWLATS